MTKQLPKFNRASNHCWWGAIIILVLGCETSFDPIEETNRYYSVFGYLNASADTQFVRIEKLRDGQFTNAPLKLDAEVKLANITTGETVNMQDSIFYYSGGSSRTHNFYTTTDIIPTNTYQLEVIDQEAITSVQTDIPEIYPKPVVADSFKLARVVEIRGVDRLILANAIYHITTKCFGDFTCDPRHYRLGFKYLQDTLHTINNNIRVEIQLLDDLLEIEDIHPPIQGERSFTVDKVDFITAAGTEDWPDFLNLSEEAAAVPGTVSNIENGVGFLGGTVTDTLLLISGPDELDW